MTEANICRLGRLVEVGPDDETAVLELARFIEKLEAGIMIDRWEFSLTPEQRDAWIGKARLTLRYVKAMAA